MRKTVNMGVVLVVALMAGHAGADEPEYPGRMYEDVTLDGSRGEGPFLVRMGQMSRQFQSPDKRLEFRHAINALLGYHREDLGLEGPKAAELDPLERERRLRKVYKRLDGMSAEDVFAAAEALDE